MSENFGPSFRSAICIATAYGLQNVSVRRAFEFENGVKAPAMNLETGSGLRALGPQEGLQEGDLVKRLAGGRTPAGEKMLGRAINAPGRPPSTGKADPHSGNPAHRA